MSAPISIYDLANNGLKFPKTPGGYQFPITPVPTVLLGDNFNGTVIDTTNRWVTPVTAGGGTMTQVGGQLVATVGTTANNAAAITSIDTFDPTVGNLTIGALLQTNTAFTTNNHRAIGFYTRPGSFTAATPIQDGYVWEVNILGELRASVYNNGALVASTVFPKDTTSTFIPVAVSYSGLNVDFYYGDFSTPIVSVSLFQAGTLNLPMGFHSINHTSGPSVAPVWSTYGVSVVDGAGNKQNVFNGQNMVVARSPNKFININAVASGTTLWTPAAGKRFRLMGYVLMTTTANGVLTLTDSVAGTVIPGGIIPLSITTPTISPPQGNGYLGSAPNSLITQVFTGGGALSGYLFGTEEG